jgi:hypothetical protein
MLRLLAWLCACAAAAAPLAPKLSLIDTWEQVKDQEPYPAPYAAIYRRGGKELRFIASRHGGDAATFALIRDAFSAPAQVLLIEGVGSEQGLSPGDFVDMMDEKAMYARSEGFYAVNLALRRGIPFQGAEPSDRDFRQAALAAGFSLKDLQGVKTIEDLIGGAGYIRDGETSLERTLEEQKRKFDIPDASALRDKAEFLAWVKQRFADTLDMDHLSRYQGAYCLGAFHRKFSDALGRFRDGHIVSVIAGMLAKYDKVLVVYGAGHRMEQAAVLKDMLGAPEYAFTRDYPAAEGPAPARGEQVFVEALIDGDSELHLSRKGFFWVSGRAAKPGKHGGRDEPTYINDKKWLPVWGKPGEDQGPDRSQTYPFPLGRLGFDVEIANISQSRGGPGGEPRDPVSVRCRIDEQVIFIPDTQEGSRWYTLRLFHRPAPGR